MAADTLKIPAIAGLMDFEARGGNLRNQAKPGLAILSRKKLPVEPRHDHRNTVFRRCIHNQAFDAFPLVGIDADGHPVAVSNPEHDTPAGRVCHADQHLGQARRRSSPSLSLGDAIALEHNLLQLQLGILPGTNGSHQAVNVDCHR